MNFISRAFLLKWPYHHKILLTMKLTAFFMFLILVQVSAKSYSQGITLNEKHSSVARILKLIEAQTGYHFLFNKIDLEKAGLISIAVENAAIEEVLKKSLENQPLSYKIIRQTIVLKSAPILPAIPKSIQLQITGKLTDEKGLPLQRVSVKVKGTNIGTITNTDGYYKINVPKNNTLLVFSYLGYVVQEISSGQQSVVNVIMKEDANTLNEVVVVGYGTQKREQITTAIASVKSEDFVQGSVNDAAQLIRGKVAGLNIVSSDANPVATAQVNLRGVPSILASSTPLVLIDGVPGTLFTVAPEDIESIDILKDGSAAAIYGTRGTNGVILITTKKVNGKTPATIDINTYFTTQSIARRLDFMNAAQYRQRVAEGRPGATDYGYETNWLDEITQTPISQVYNISLKGGDSNTNYIANINYRSIEGIVKRSDNKVLFPRIEFNHKMFDGKLKLNANINGYQQKYYASADQPENFTSTESNSFRGDIYRNGLTFNPTDRVKDDNGVWIERIEKTDYMNPVALLEETQGLVQNNNFRTFGNITYSPNNDINVKLLLSRDLYNSTRGYYETKKHFSTIRDGKNGYASRGTTRTQEDLLELTADYHKIFKDHEITGLVGYSWRNNNYQDYWMQNWDFPTDDFSYNNMGAGLALKRGQAPENSIQTENKLVGYFFRINYNYKEKYLLMASIRHEGSSKFGRNYKWGNFPAISIGWNAIREDFLRDLKVLNNLKFRAGFGITGTEPTDPYRSLSLINFDTYSLVDGQWIQVVNPSLNPNPDLRWEKKEELNIGVDYGFFDNRISGSIDYYKRTTKDLLMDYPVPTPPYLYSTIRANAASMQNKGLEVQINGIPVQSDNFQWRTSVNFSTNRNKILSLSDENFQLASGYFDAGETGEPIQQRTHRVQVGQPIGNFYGFKTIDIDENGYWIIEGKDGNPKSISNQQADDKQIIGNGLPQYYASWNNTFVYKNFDLNITMRGAFGFQILNMPEMFYGNPVMLTRGNLLNSAYDNIFDKRPLADDQSLNYVSYYIEDGDYWKIDNVTLGYNVGLKSKYIKRIRLYGAVSNLATITGYKGIDPEVSINGLSPGIDNKNRYPSTTSYTLGAFLTF
ncbi:TonB-linked outer membrane protein, SusC/RagA family [Olivibacter domesticus]|uniref:TonB-linked outer membrane protein, SusC/RagA family n=2 Tax=Olivibacter domesticus TaxID=407022 RepID=A0A1H7W3J6_OLID1|nr:TonB-linked outer membrane protein, SusC/RagA family [Olivibacter domesticus]